MVAGQGHNYGAARGRSMWPRSFSEDTSLDHTGRTSGGERAKTGGLPSGCYLGCAN